MLFKPPKLRVWKSPAKDGMARACLPITCQPPFTPLPQGRLRNTSLMGMSPTAPTLPSWMHKALVALGFLQWQTSMLRIGLSSPDRPLSRTILKGSLSGFPFLFSKLIEFEQDRIPPYW